MLCQRILIVAAHGPMRAIAQGDDGDLVLLWDSTLLYLTRDSLLCLDDVLTRAKHEESVSTDQFQWHPAPDDAALVWMGRTCFYLPSEDKPIFCALVHEAAEQLRSLALRELRSQSPFSPAFCQLTVAEADEVALN
jgi:hypothetical protein